ncbi:molybdopterin-dependent oxidoreductase [bacterium]|nr:molybdopterin-dependent oxidoreductase [bacterium]
MATRFVHSICGMCTFRCPITVEVRDGRVKHIWGNPHVTGGYNLCPRGAAGRAFEYDDERPQTPLLRDGARGSGRWKKAAWDEALDFVADKLAAIKEKHGAKALVMSDRGGPHREFHRTFFQAYGSPNYFNHHATCSNSVHNAHMSMTGLARNGVAYDYKRCKYLLSFGRNFLEAVGTGEAKNIIDLIERGTTFTHIDVRWTYTGSKATNLYVVKPGSDYAIASAMLHVLIKENLVNREFIADWVNGFDDLAAFARDYTPEFAEQASGMPADAIRRVARDMAEAAPSVLLYPGYMTAWGSNDYYLRRALYAINALLGTYEAPGGMVFPKGPGDVGVKIRQLTGQAPKPEESERFDGIGTTCHHLGKGWGMAQLLPKAILEEDPYPIRGYIAQRHDPLASLPDPAAFKQALEKLDILVSVDVNWSETAWNADVILPECTYLERTDNVIVRKGLKPRLALRQQAVEPRFDSRPRWWIYKQLAKRLGIDEFLPYETIEEEIDWQLEGTGYTHKDFEETGEIKLTDEEIWYDRKDGLKFKKRSGKIELQCDELTDCGVPCWAPYEAPPEFNGDKFRLITGKKAVHTQGRTTANNPLLHEITPENTIYIHTSRAKNLGLKTGDKITLTPEEEDKPQTGTLEVTDFIHPDAVFMLHGFGDTVPVRSRSFGKGVKNMQLSTGKLRQTVGGNCPLTDTFVQIAKA